MGLTDRFCPVQKRDMIPRVGLYGIKWLQLATFYPVSAELLA